MEHFQRINCNRSRKSLNFQRNGTFPKNKLDPFLKTLKLLKCMAEENAQRHTKIERERVIYKARNSLMPNTWTEGG
jgi:hypothetical protein